MQWKGQLRKVLPLGQPEWFFLCSRSQKRQVPPRYRICEAELECGFRPRWPPNHDAELKSSRRGTLIFPDNQEALIGLVLLLVREQASFYVSARDGYSTLFVKEVPKNIPRVSGMTGAGRRRPSNLNNVVGEDMDKVLAIRALDPNTGDLEMAVHPQFRTQPESLWRVADQCWGLPAF